MKRARDNAFRHPTLELVGDVLIERQEETRRVFGYVLHRFEKRRRLAAPRDGINHEMPASASDILKNRSVKGAPYDRFHENPRLRCRGGRCCLTQEGIRPSRFRRYPPN